MSGQFKERAHDQIRRLARAGLDVAQFLDEASAAIAPAVPNGTASMEQPYWYTLDPESHLITSDYGGSGCSLDTAAVMRWEYLDDDVNKYAEVLRHPRGVQTLHEVTGGQPERSRIYREYMAAEVGFGAGDVGGAARPHQRDLGHPTRGWGQPEFDTSDLRFMATVSPHWRPQPEQAHRCPQPAFIADSDQVNTSWRPRRCRTGQPGPRSANPSARRSRC